MFLKAATVVLLATFSAGAFAASELEVLEKEKAALEEYCKADIERLCPGIKPGGGRIKECLKTHKEEISVGCAQALQALKKAMQ